MPFPWLVSAVAQAVLALATVCLIVAALLVRVGTMLMWPHNERLQYLSTPYRLDVIALGCLLAILVRSPAFTADRRMLGIVGIAVGSSCSPRQRGRRVSTEPFRSAARPPT